MGGFDAMGFVMEPGMPPCLPQIDDPELKEKWAAVLAEDDITAAKKSRKVKKLVRTGVPPSLRREISGCSWPMLQCAPSWSL